MSSDRYATYQAVEWWRTNSKAANFESSIPPMVRVAFGPTTGEVG
uniref:Uncharacterized protein n=1 Tax=Pseudomonas fluorescens (strain SBW25) TaxID=216595 RepID=A0A0G4E566_PSEFS|nr:hypothetical protein PQBR57_0423 [Pseudomonas fluorescens SBW25]